MKRPVLKEWIKTHDPTTCGLEEIHFISIVTNTLKVKRWGGGKSTQIVTKRAEMARLISAKIDFKPKKSTNKDIMY